MIKGTLFGVSVGPGDPELLTLKARNILAACPVIAAPRTAGGRTLALEIAAQAVDLTAKTVVYLDLLMTRDARQLAARRRELALQLSSYLDQGQDVALLNLGDASLYGSWAYINELVKTLGYATATIPGVTSFCAAAASLNTSLTEPDLPLHIIPASYDGLEQSLALPGTKVLMKAGNSLPELRRLLQERGLAAQAALAANCGLADEVLCKRLEQAPPLAGYFTIILLKP